jgi:hypothetical protein
MKNDINGWTKVLNSYKRRYRYEKISGKDEKTKRAYESFKMPAYKVKRRETISEYVERKVKEDEQRQPSNALQ